MSERSKVIIIGGGFGGLSAAEALKSAPVEVTLIDRRNYHLFQPLCIRLPPVRSRLVKSQHRYAAS